MNPQTLCQQHKSPIENVIVVDGEVITPMVAGFLAGKNDYVMFASSGIFESPRRREFQNVRFSAVLELPIDSRSAQLTLASRVREALLCHPSLRKAQWRFVSSRRKLEFLKRLLMEEGVPDNHIRQVTLEHIQKAKERVLSSQYIQPINT